MTDEEIVTICLKVEVKRCCYWDKESQTYRHTCGGCEGLSNGNSIETVHCGIMVDGKRYCMLDVDIYGEIIEEVKEK